MICKITSNPEFIIKGAQIAIDHHEQLIKFVFEILEKKLVRSTGTFRYVIVEANTFGDKFNINFSVLYRITAFLQIIYSEVSGKFSGKGEHKSFLLAVEDKKRASYHVLGISSYNKSSKKYSRELNY